MGKQKQIKLNQAVRKYFPLSEKELLVNLNGYTAHADELAIISESKIPPSSKNNNQRENLKLPFLHYLRQSLFKCIGWLPTRN